MVCADRYKPQPTFHWRLSMLSTYIANMDVWKPWPWGCLPLLPMSTHGSKHVFTVVSIFQPMINLHCPISVRIILRIGSFAIAALIVDITTTPTGLGVCGMGWGKFESISLCHTIRYLIPSNTPPLSSLSPTRWSSVVMVSPLYNCPHPGRWSYYHSRSMVVILTVALVRLLGRIFQWLLQYNSGLWEGYGLIVFIALGWCTRV